MKTITAIILLALLTVSAYAQTFEEWFRQKETQKEYLVQQIAALQAYSGTLWQGYEIVRQGISTVQRIKSGDLGLHQDFFSSLKQVNPVIGQANEMADIIFWQTAIHHLFNKIVGQGELLTMHEKQYLEQVKKKVLESAARDLELLLKVLTANELNLQDDERIRQLRTVHQHMHSTYQFTVAFHKEVQVLALQRLQEKKDAEYLRKLYSIF